MPYAAISPLHISNLDFSLNARLVHPIVHLTVSLDLHLKHNISKAKFLTSFPLDLHPGLPVTVNHLFVLPAIQVENFGVVLDSSSKHQIPMCSSLRINLESDHLHRCHSDPHPITSHMDHTNSLLKDLPVRGAGATSS